MTDFADYISLYSAEITFEPYGPLTGCVDIIINRDFLVEYPETFRFVIDQEQEDESVVVSYPSVAVVTILDEEEGKNL